MTKTESGAGHRVLLVDENHAVQATNDGRKAKGPKLVTAFSVAEAPAPDSDVIKRAQ